MGWLFWAPGEAVTLWGPQLQGQVLSWFSVTRSPALNPPLLGCQTLGPWSTGALRSSLLCSDAWPWDLLPGGLSCLICVMGSA